MAVQDNLDILRPEEEQNQDDSLPKALETAFGERFPGQLSSEDENRLPDRPEILSALVGLVMTKAREADDTMWEHRRNWALNIEYMLDRQWSVWSRKYREIERNPRREHRFAPRIQLNLFKTIVLTAISRFLSTRPTILIQAGAHDQNVIDAARVANRIVGEYEWARQKMDEILARSLPHIMLMGGCAWKVEWDPDDGNFLFKKPRYVLDPITGEPVMEQDEAGNQLGAPQQQVDQITGRPIFDEVYEGNVRTTVCDPKELLVDPGALTLDDAMWVIHAARRTPAWIFNKYGVRVDADSGDSQGDSETAFWRSVRESRDAATVTVYEAWLRPGKYPFGPGENEVREFPTGYVITVCGGRVLDHGPNPYGDLPFVYIPCIRVPREFWGDTWVNSLRSPQASLNKTVSQIVHANDLMGNPQWLLPNGSKVPEADRSSRPAIWIRYEPVLNGLKPEPVQPPTVSIGVFKHLDFLKMVLQDISGQYDGGMKGGSPGGRIESGIALEAIAERDTTRLHATAAEIGRGIEQWAIKTTKLIREFWTQPRLVTVTGTYLESETLEFSGGDMHESFNVKIVPDSVIPQSKHAKFQKAFTLYQAGLLSARDAKRRMGEETGEELTLEQLQVNKARDENRQARDSGQINTLREEISLHDHVLHIQEHLRALFDPAIQPGSPAWMALYAHTIYHNQVFNSQMAPPEPPPQEGPGEGPEESSGSPPRNEASE